jgi:hypothetical protein
MNGKMKRMRDHLLYPHVCIVGGERLIEGGKSSKMIFVL